MTTAAIPDPGGRVAVVTGAASGIGLALATRFAAEGMRVLLADIEADRLREAEERLGSSGAEVRGQVVDVSDEASVQALAEAAFGTWGRVDILCNNAGVLNSGRAWAFTDDDWEWSLGVNLRGVIYGVRHFVPRMMAQGVPGHVVNTASMAALVPMMNKGSYAAAKAAVVAFSETLQVDLDDEGADISVSVLCPGFVPTDIRNSARNRPDRLGEQAPRPSPSLITGLTATIDADETAGLVLRAIREKRFWVLTHEQYKGVVAEIVDGIDRPFRPVAAPIW